jgi:hypothetical protein
MAPMSLAVQAVQAVSAPSTVCASRVGEKGISQLIEITCSFALSLSNSLSSSFAIELSSIVYFQPVTSINVD